MLTHERAAALVCPNCARGVQPKVTSGPGWGPVRFHNTPFTPCPAQAIWDDAEKTKGGIAP